MELRLLDFRRWESCRFNDDIVGMAFVEICHRLTVHHVSCFVWNDELGNDGQPILSKLNLLPELTFELDAIVWDCLERLVQKDILHKDTKITNIMMKEGENAFYVQGWSSDWKEPECLQVTELKNEWTKLAGQLNNTTPKKAEAIRNIYRKMEQREKNKKYFQATADENKLYDEGLRDFLFERLAEVEVKDEVFSELWYLLKICSLYMRRRKITVNVATTIGVLVEQMAWKFRLEENAIRGMRIKSNLASARVKQKEVARTKSEKKDDLIAITWKNLLSELGPQVMHNNELASRHIHDFFKGLEPAPEEILVKSKGQIIGIETIRRRLPSLKRQRKIGQSY